jgi:hypothetical protein
VFITYPASKSANINAALTSGRVTFATTDGLLTDSAGLTFDGTNFATTGTATAAKLIPTGTSVTGNGMYLPATNSIGISTAGTNAVYIDASQNVGIGTSSPGSYAKLTVLGGSIYTDAALYSNDGTTVSRVISSGSVSYWGTTTNQPVVYQTNNIERMRIDTSGNVGIGTVPSNRLDVTAALGVVNVSSSTGTNYVKLQVNNTGGSFQFAIENSAGSNFGAPAYSRVLWNDGAYPTVFFVNASEKMRIDASGQVGIGFTPLTTQGNLQVYKSISGGNPATSGTTDANQVFAVNASSVQLSYGAYANGQGWIQQRNSGNFATNYDLVLQPNGGNLLVGTTSSVGRVTSSQNSAGSYSSAFSAYATGGANSQLVGYSFLPTFGNTTDYTPRRAADIWGGFNAGNWTTEFLAFGVGTGGGNDAGNLTTERMRIDGSGNFFIGKTTGNYLNVGLQTEGAGKTLGVTTNSASPTFFGNRSSTGDYLTCYYNGTGIGAVLTSNGTTTTFATSSDYRLKENIIPMTGALAKVAQLKPVTYKWKVNGSDGQGFIAHELQEVVPDAVTGDKDAVDANGKPKYQGIDTSFLVATLTAAIQEQQTLIQSLTTRLTALEQK